MHLHVVKAREKEITTTEMSALVQRSWFRNFLSFEARCIIYTETQEGWILLSLNLQDDKARQEEVLFSLMHLMNDVKFHSPSGN